MSTILLWLFVINLGIAFGAGLYEHRIVVSKWINTSGESGAHWNAGGARLDDTGRRFWAFVSTVPLTLLTLANLFAAWRASGAVRGWWLAAGLAALADRAFTFSYFIPMMVGLMGAADTPESNAVAESQLSASHDRVGSLAGIIESIRTLLSEARIEANISPRRLPIAELIARWCQVPISRASIIGM